MKKIIILLNIVLFSFNGAFAQITTGEYSHSRFESLPKFEAAIELSKPAETKANMPDNCIGRLINSNQSFFNNADSCPVDGGTVWRLTVDAEDAYSLGVNFSEIELANNVELCIYSSKDFLGMLTYKNNNDAHTLKTRQIIGNSITIELFVPDNVIQNDFVISKICYGFKSIGKALKTKKKPSSIKQDENINGEAGQKWQTEKHGVCHYQFDCEDGYTYVCTGALVNNTNNDATPYFITAAHCICKESEANTIVVYYNYENDLYGNLSSQMKTASGATLIAYPTRTYRSKLRDFTGQWITDGEYNDYDISLLKLSDIPPQNYLPYYLGWTLDTKNYIDTVVTIHHPGGDAKCIAVSNMPPYVATYPISDEIFVENTHWCIDTWHLGYTETGSSGAPLFNQNGRIIGVLSGGMSSRSNPYEDYFQMISKMWTGDDGEEHHLAYWLANNTGISELNGFDPYALFTDYPAAVLSGSWNSDSSAIQLKWETTNGIKTFSTDFEQFTTAEDIQKVFLTVSDFDHQAPLAKKYGDNPTSWCIKTESDGTEFKPYSGTKVLASFTASLNHTDDCLITKKINIQDDQILTFRTRSVGGESLLNIGCSSDKPTDFDTLALLTIGTDWQDYAIPLSRFKGQNIYFNFNNITEPDKTNALLLNNIDIMTDTTGIVFDPQGYRIYCNNKKIAYITDNQTLTYTYTNIAPDSEYTFYIETIYAESEKPSVSNPVQLNNIRHTPTAVSDFVINESNIYPNPAQNFINIISNSDLGLCTISVFNTSGAMVKQYKATVNQQQPCLIDLSGIKSGIYIINIKNHNLSINQKLVVKQ